MTINIPYENKSSNVRELLVEPSAESFSLNLEDIILFRLNGPNNNVHDFSFELYDDTLVVYESNLAELTIFINDSLVFTSSHKFL